MGARCSDVAAALLLAGAAAAGPAGPGAAPKVDGARRVHVEPSPERAEQAERLRREADDLRRRLAETEGARASILERARRLDQELALTRSRAAEAAASADAESEAAAIAADRARSLQGRVAALRRRAGLVARALYVQGREAPIVTFLDGGRRAGGHVGSVVAQRQASLAVDLRRAQDAATAAADEAESRAREARRLAVQADEAQAVLRREASLREAALRKLSTQAARDAAAAEEKDRAAEELLRDLTPGELSRRRAQAPRPQPGVVLPGLSLQRGRLPWPLPGRRRVLESWGTVRDARRGTSTLRHGITIEARRGEPIRAIADGRVLFVDWYKAFGRCLVLDHGEGFLSVMAHADAFSVEAGDVVRQGDVVGEAGDTGSLEGPRLWLQIQRSGESVDPLQWLTSS